MNPRSKEMLRWALVVVALIVGIWLGAKIRRGAPGEQASTVSHAHDEPEEVWTCPMHPQIRRTEPGKCPICGMDLTLATTQESVAGPRQFVTSPEAVKLMEIEVHPVERRAVERTLRLFGKVDVDERKLAYLTAWAPGRIEKLHVNFTGAVVKAGDPMFDLYSPELISAQQELIQALRTAGQLGESLGETGASAARTIVNAARERLRLWGLSDEQIQNIEKRDEPLKTVTFHAPSGGVVIQREGQLGMYVETGARIFSIADLSTVWAQLDAYESDLQWLKTGQQATITAEALPGEEFRGEVEFIDPLLSQMTRTTKVRLTVENAGHKLKPGMFVRASIHAALGTRDAGEEATHLVIPASAALVTGPRAIVYVQLPETEKPTFEGREIVLGPRAGDQYIVNEGLAEGELVVTRGNFKIDSSLQIRGQPSMMQPEGGAGVSGHAQHGAAAPPRAAGEPEAPPAAPAETPEEFRKQLSAFSERYFAISEALASDNPEAALKAAAEAKKALQSVDMMLLKGADHDTWMQSLAILNQALDRLTNSANIASMRTEFEPLSNEIISAARRFGLIETAFVAHCPMASGGRGANWLQKMRDIRNPYFGASMLTCGDIVETIRAPGIEEETHRHE